MTDFDFDGWANLVRQDPGAYFDARERAIRRFIDSHSSSQAERLWEMQDRIDAVRALAASPLQALRELAGMMEDQIEALQTSSDRLADSSRQFSALVKRLRSN